MAVRSISNLFAAFLILLFLLPLAFLAREGFISLLGDGEVLPDRILYEYAETSALLFFGSVAGAVLVGFGAAYLCARFEFWMRKPLIWLSILPLSVPGYLVAYTWVDFLVDVGVPGGYLRNMPVACIVFAVSLSPYVFLPVYGALTRVSQAHLETSFLLSQSVFRTFFRVELPLVRASVLIGAVLAGMEVLADFGTVDFLAIDTWSTGIYRSWFGLDNRGRASLLGMALFLISALLLFLESWLRNRKLTYSNVRNARPARRLTLSGGWGFPLVCLALFPAILGILGPVCILIFRIAASVHEPQWLQVWKPFFTSLGVAVLASGIVVGIGIVLSALARAKSSAVIRFGLSLAKLGYALPGGVIALGILVFLAQFSLTGTLFALVFAYVIRFVTIGTTTVDGAWSSLPRVYGEQAGLLGCCELAVFFRVWLPLLKNSIASAFLLTAIDVIKELPATMLLRPFDFETLAIRTYNLASDERLAETAPTALSMIVLCALALFAVQRLGAFDVYRKNTTTFRKKYEYQ
jgi:iron(III) transport system permease protein